MAEIIQEMFAVLGLNMVAPTNIAEFIPWFVTVLLCCGFVGVLLRWLYILISSFGRSM